MILSLKIRRIDKRAVKYEMHNDLTLENLNLSTQTISTSELHTRYRHMRGLKVHVDLGVRLITIRSGKKAQVNVSTRLYYTVKETPIIQLKTFGVKIPESRIESDNYAHDRHILESRKIEEHIRRQNSGIYSQEIRPAR